MRCVKLCSIHNKLGLRESRRRQYGMCGSHCLMNHNLHSNLSLLLMYFRSRVDDTIHWPRQNYECDHVSYVRGKNCSCGQLWQMDVEENKKLHNVDGACAWVESTGDVICSNHAKPPFYGLNPICSYLDLAVKMVCRCQPSISIAKHGRMKKSRCKNHCNSLLRTENIYCPWGKSSSFQRFCQVCFHYCGIQHGSGPM